MPQNKTIDEILPSSATQLSENPTINEILIKQGAAVITKQVARQAIVDLLLSLPELTIRVPNPEYAHLNSPSETETLSEYNLRTIEIRNAIKQAMGVG